MSGHSAWPAALLVTDSPRRHFGPVPQMHLLLHTTSRWTGAYLADAEECADARAYNALRYGGSGRSASIVTPVFVIDGLTASGVVWQREHEVLSLMSVSLLSLIWKCWLS